MINRYTYIKDIKIIDYDKRKVLIKKKKKYDIDKIYKYLDDHNINNYLKPYKITDKELYFDYIDKKDLASDEVAKRLVYNLADIQNKTTIYKEIDKDKLKEEYDTFNNKINYLEEYYFNMQDIIENKAYMSPSA